MWFVSSFWGEGGGGLELMPLASLLGVATLVLPR